MAYSDDQKPSGLTAITSLATDDVVIVGDTSDVNEVVKKITWANIQTLIEAFTSYFNVSTDTLDDITAGATNKHFTATDETKLDGIETSADVTDATNVAAAGAVMDTGNETVAGIKTFSSSPIVPAPTTDLQAATKKYVDDNAGGASISDAVYGAAWNGVTTIAPSKNAVYDKIETLAGGHDAVTVTDSAEINFTLVAQDITAVLIAGSIDETKLDTSVNASLDLADSASQATGVENSADVTDVTNVTAAGALMDSEVTNLADVKAFDTTDYATAAQGSTADSAVQPASTDTLTNKRITKREQTVASAATVTPVWTNDDLVTITAQAVGLTLANPTGTGTDGQPMVIRIKDNATTRTIAYGTQYRAIGVTLPTATTASKTIYLGGFWNVADSKLDVTAVAEEA